MDIFNTLKVALREVAISRGILESRIEVECKALSAREAIGDTEHDDYPIHKGKEVMVEATFAGAKGQAFTDQFEQASYSVAELIDLELIDNKSRASFISGINAIWKHLGKAEKTVHCRNEEPVECAKELPKHYDCTKKTLLVGLQPRFLEVLATRGEVRALDLDPDNIGKVIAGVTIEDGANFLDAQSWCEQIFATGSTLCNASTQGILECGKPITFFGVTIAAAADILGLDTYCVCGH